MVSISIKRLINCMDAPMALVTGDADIVCANRSAAAFCAKLQSDLSQPGEIPAWLAEFLRSSAPIPVNVAFSDDSTVRLVGQRIVLPDFPGPLVLIKFSPIKGVVERFTTITTELQNRTNDLRQERLRSRALAARNVELDRKASRDHLTGLLRQDAFDRQVAEKLAQDDLGGILIVLDLNELKTINDRYGHLVGDQVIRTSGDRISHQIRESDVASRLGGDEFALFFSGPMTDQQAVSVVNRLDRALKDPISCDHPESNARLTVLISASIGVLPVSAGPSDMGALRNAADQAMYLAKRSVSQLPKWAEMATGVDSQNRCIAI